MFNVKTIIHPTDFSSHARPAFDLACGLAKQNNARLLLLHVMVPASAFGATIPNPSVPAEQQKDLGKFPWPSPTPPSLRVEHRVAEGDVPAEILRLARKEKCDLIVIGTHGRQGLNRLLMGSVAEEVLREATCPVLALRVPSAS